MKKLFVLHGSYFGDNFGDRLFVDLFVKWALELEGIEAGHISIPFSGKRIRESIHCSKARGILAILQSKCIVYIGGGYFGEPKAKAKIWNIRMIIRYILIGLYASLVRKPYMFVGIGAGPLSSKLSRKLVTIVCNRSEKVIVRDHESYEYLKEYGVRENKLLETADSVMAMPGQSQKKTTEKPKIALHFPFNRADQDIANLIQDIKTYCDLLSDYEIVYFKDFYKEDYDDCTAKEILRVFPSEKVSQLEYEDPEQLIREIRSFDILVTAKLHVGIVALSNGVFSISVAAHQKTKRLYKQLGIEEFSISLKNYEKHKVIELLELYSKKEQILPESIVQLADQNRKEFHEFLSNNFLK